MSIRQSQELLVKTPEGVVFSIPLAGMITRTLALLVDFMVIIILAKAVNFVTIWFMLVSSDLMNSLNIILYFIISTGYTIFFEWGLRGQTLGKRLLGLQVIDADALPLKFSQVVMRNLLRFVDALPAFYLVGGITAFFTSKVQRLGDLAANTVVIRHRRADQPSLEKIFAGKYNSFCDYPHLVAKLKQRIDIMEADIALQALSRRDDMSDSDRLLLFDRLASHFKEIIEFPEKTTFGLSSEQYVKNVVDLLFTKKKM
ncbi:MAG: RDD family protein [Verrucomicrobiota bacterium]